MQEHTLIQVFADGRGVFVDLLTFGRARIGVGPADKQWYDDTW